MVCYHGFTMNVPFCYTHYEATVYYRSSGSSHTKLYPFTQAQAFEVGGVLEPDGLAREYAEKLITRWNARGRCGDIRYSYRLP
jgi:hypothetical protein